MNKLLTIATVFILVAPSLVLAQDNESKTENVYEPVIHTKVTNGVTFSLVKDFTKTRNKLKILDFTFKSNKEKADQKIGLAIGYSDINIQKIGWNSRLLFNSYDDGVDTKILEGEANLTFGLNKNIFSYAGVSMNKMFEVSEVIDGKTVRLDPKLGFGYQFGMGFQATQNIGVMLGYTSLNSKGDIKVDGFGKVGKMDTYYKGFEFSLVATF